MTEAQTPFEQEDPMIGIEDFMKVELRVGKILTCEPVPKSKKLLKMQVDVAEAEPRQILAGLSPFYIPAEMIGRRVVVVANLKPAKLMGLESQGMLLAASGEGKDAVASLVAVPEGIPVGGKVR